MATIKDLEKQWQDQLAYEKKWSAIAKESMAKARASKNSKLIEQIKKVEEGRKASAKRARERIKKDLDDARKKAKKK